jgi:hypothetical protein
MKTMVLWARAQNDRAVGFSLLILAGLFIIVTYTKVSGTKNVSDGLSYVASGGVGGLFLLGCAATLLISADLRDGWRHLDLFESLVANPTSSTNSVLVSTRLIGAAVVGSGLGMIAVFAGWLWASSTHDADTAMGGLARAAAGTVVTAASAGGFLVCLRRRVETSKRELRSKLRAATGGRLAPADAAGVVVVEGLSRYHLPDCPALTGLDVRRRPIRQIPSELTPCGLCHAD